jgi:hypothetical protein
MESLIAQARETRKAEVVGGGGEDGCTSWRQAVAPRAKVRPQSPSPLMPSRVLRWSLAASKASATAVVYVCSCFQRSGLRDEDGDDDVLLLLSMGAEGIGKMPPVAPGTRPEAGFHPGALVGASRRTRRMGSHLRMVKEAPAISKEVM